MSLLLLLYLLLHPLLLLLLYVYRPPIRFPIHPVRCRFTTYDRQHVSKTYTRISCDRRRPTSSNIQHTSSVFPTPVCCISSRRIRSWPRTGLEFKLKLTIKTKWIPSPDPGHTSTRNKYGGCTVTSVLESATFQFYTWFASGCCCVLYV